jgi:hypothetical protein
VMVSWALSDPMINVRSNAYLLVFRDSVILTPA